MDPKAEITSFLSSRRAKLSPDEAGVAFYAGRRRVAGLRREEVAQLAGVSTDYYARLERGKVAGASRDVLEAVARALQLNDDERDHLFDLVKITQTRSRQRRTTNTTVRPGLQLVLDSIQAPAYLQNARLDRLAANPIGRALYSHPMDGSQDRFNYALWLFLDPRAHEFHRDYDAAKNNVVALLHTATAKQPHDQGLIDVIGRLSTQSEEFRGYWARHDVFRYRRGAKLLTHSVMGDLEFGYETFELASDPGLVMLVYTVEPNSPTAEAMQILSSWTAPTSTNDLGARETSDRATD
ncbi:MAG: helix-turn-helix transcriptional regulator [Nocardioides sp.]|uniref:helix-turn-helix transcriptional regulator n=1 Tax=Nocardioides sp. TaxID=35761 RepID=UPI0039E59608